MPSFKEVSSTSNIFLPEPHLSPKSAALGIPIDLLSLSKSVVSSVSLSANTNQDAPSIDELKRRIYGGKSSAGKVRKLFFNF